MALKAYEGGREAALLDGLAGVMVLNIWRQADIVRKAIHCGLWIHAGLR